MHPECVFWMAANWPWIGRKTMTSRFVDMVSWSTFFDVDVFPMSSLVTGPGFMSISWLVSELWQFLFKGLTRNLEIGKTAVWFLPNIPRWMSLIKKLLLTTLLQGCSFYHFWVYKEKRGRGGSEIKINFYHFWSAFSAFKLACVCFY